MCVSKYIVRRTIQSPHLAYIGPISRVDMSGVEGRGQGLRSASRFMIMSSSKVLAMISFCCIISKAELPNHAKLELLVARRVRREGQSLHHSDLEKETDRQLTRKQGSANIQNNQDPDCRSPDHGPAWFGWECLDDSDDGVATRLPHGPRPTSLRATYMGNYS